MLIRISLITAIVLGLAVAGVNILVVKPNIDKTVAQRDQNAKDRDMERSEKQKAQKDAKETHKKLDDTLAELKTTQDQRDTAVAAATDAKKQLDVAMDNLKKVTEERDTAQNELAAWRAVGVPVDQIVRRLNEIKEVNKVNAALAGENKVLNGKVVKLSNKIKELLDPEYVVQMPEGLKGKVLVVDPKYDFVMLNIGEKQGVQEDGQFLVNRNGRLVAKLKVKSVQSDRSIANVMPGWKQSDVMEGDEVIY